MTTRRLGTIAVAAAAVLTLAACGGSDEPTVSATYGEQLSLDVAGTDASIELTVDEPESVSDDQAADWGIREFSDPDRNDAAALSFVLVRFDVGAVEGDYESYLVSGTNWALETSSGVHPGAAYLIDEAAGCDVPDDGLGAACLALAVPSGEDVTGVRYTSVKEVGSAATKDLTGNNHALWTSG